MKILVTGSAGFVGSATANYLSKYHNVIGVDDLSFGNIKNVKHKFVRMSFNDLQTDYINEFDTLIHCATSNIIYSQDNPIDTFINNAIYTCDLFERFKGQIIYTSTTSVYGNADTLPTPESQPLKLTNAYDTSKYVAEQYLQLRGDYTILRLSNVYGPGQRPDNPYCGVIGRLVNKALHNEPLTVIGDGKDTRDYTYIDDVVRAIDLVVESGPIYDILNISGSVEYDINTIVTLITQSMPDIDLKIEHIEKRTIDKIKRRWIDNSRAKELIKWKPETDLFTGLLETIYWQKKKNL